MHEANKKGVQAEPGAMHTIESPGDGKVYIVWPVPESPLPENVVLH